MARDLLLCLPALSLDKDLLWCTITALGSSAAIELLYLQRVLSQAREVLFVQSREPIASSWGVLCLQITGGARVPVHVVREAAVFSLCREDL